MDADVDAGGAPARRSGGDGRSRSRSAGKYACEARGVKGGFDDRCLHTLEWDGLADLCAYLRLDLPIRLPAGFSHRGSNWHLDW